MRTAKLQVSVQSKLNIVARRREIGAIVSINVHSICNEIMLARRRILKTLANPTMKVQILDNDQWVKTWSI